MAIEYDVDGFIVATSKSAKEIARQQKYAEMKKMRAIDTSAETPTRGEIPLWDFSIPILPEMEIYEDSTPYQETSPAIELFRSQVMTDLRRSFDDDCKKTLLMAEPSKGALDRWFLHLICLPISEECDVILRAPASCVETDVIRRELQAELPCKSIAFLANSRKMRTYNYKTIRQELTRYVENANIHLAELESVYPSFASFAGQAVTVGDSVSPAEDVYRLRFAVDALKKVLDEIVAANDATDALRLKIFQITSAIKIRWRRLLQEKLELVLSRLQQSAVRTVESIKNYASSSPAVLPVQLSIFDTSVELSYDRDIIKISPLYYQKFCRLYYLALAKKEMDEDLMRKIPSTETANNANNFPKYQKFLCRLYCMLRRYTTLIASNLDAGNFDEKINSFALSSLISPSEAVFQQLQQASPSCAYLELFSSPINCYYQKYCSPFFDVDKYFNSLGHVASRDRELSGNVLIKFSYTEEILTAILSLVEKALLSPKSSAPVSIVLFAPNWCEPLCEPVEQLNSEKFAPFKRFLLSLASGSYEFVSGSQAFKTNPNERYYRAMYDSRVYLLERGIERSAEEIENLSAALERRFAFSK